MHRTFVSPIVVSLILLAGHSPLLGQRAYGEQPTDWPEIQQQADSLLPAPKPREKEPDAVAGYCAVEDELAKKVIASAAEKEAARLLLGILAMTSRYEEVRKAEAMQEIVIDSGAPGKLITRLIKLQDNYVTSGSPLSEDSGPTSRASFAAVPPALLAVIGTLAARGNSGRSLRLAGWVGSITGILGVIGVSSGKTIGAAALRATAQELSIGQRRQIHDVVEGKTTGPSRYLGDVLQWDARKRAKFTRALNDKVIQTLSISAKDVATKYSYGKRNEYARPEYTLEEILPRLTADLAAIDFIALIETHGLATPDQTNGLRVISQIGDEIARLNPTLTPVAAEALLREKRDGVATMKAIVRIHRLLEETAKSIDADSEEGKALATLQAQTIEALLTIKSLCVVGR